MSRSSPFLLLALYLAIFFAFSLWSVDGELGDQAYENLAMVEFLAELRASNESFTPLGFQIEYTNAFRSMQWFTGDFLGLPESDPILSYLWGNSLAKVLALNVLELLGWVFSEVSDQMVVLAIVQLGFLVFFSYYAVSRYFGRWAASLSVFIFCSDIFLMQLLHSQLEPQLIYGSVLLLLGVGIFLGIVHRCGVERRWWTCLSVAVWAAFCQLNGYPNTQIIIPLYMAVLYCSWAIASVIVGRSTCKILVVETAFLMLAFIVGSSIGFLLIGLWFEGIRYDFHAGLENTLSNIRTILNMLTQFSGEDSRNIGWNVLPQIFDLFGNTQRTFTGPHQPGMLLGQHYFGWVKIILFGVGVFALVRRWREPLAFSFLILLLALIIRLSIDELVMIWKTNFDAFYALNIFVLIGAVAAVKTFRSRIVVAAYSIGRDLARLAFRGYAANPFQLSRLHLFTRPEDFGGRFRFFYAIVLGIFVCFISGMQFSSNFMGDHNRNLGEWDGLAVVRDYVISRANNKSKILVITDYSWGRELTPQRIFLKPNDDFYLASLTHLLTQTPEMVSKKLTDTNISEVLVISDGSLNRVAHFVDVGPQSLFKEGGESSILLKTGRSIPVTTSNGPVKYFIQRYDVDEFQNALAYDWSRAGSNNIWWVDPTFERVALKSAQCLFGDILPSGYQVEGVLNTNGLGIISIHINLNEINDVDQQYVRFENGLTGYDPEVTRLQRSHPQFMLKQKDNTKAMHLDFSVPMAFDRISYGELVIPAFFTNGEGDVISVSVHASQSPLGGKNKAIVERSFYGDGSGEKGSVDFHPKGVWTENAAYLAFNFEREQDLDAYLNATVSLQGAGATRLASGSRGSFQLTLMGYLSPRAVKLCAE